MGVAKCGRGTEARGMSGAQNGAGWIGWAGTERVAGQCEFIEIGFKAERQNSRSRSAHIFSLDLT